MHCQNCGGQVRSHARFCNQCGIAVVEKFGSALLAKPNPTALETPTENLTPKTRTAPNTKAVSTLEGQAHLETDQLGLRGTGRQPLTKVTSEDAVPKLELRTTVVEARVFNEVAPTKPVALTQPGPAATKVEIPALPPPPPAAAFIPPPQLQQSGQPAAPAKPAEIEYLTPSTQELQSFAANQPFFTRMPTPGENRQHKYLIYAVPLVLLAALVIMFIAFYVQR